VSAAVATTAQFTAESLHDNNTANVTASPAALVMGGYRTRQSVTGVTVMRQLMNPVSSLKYYKLAATSFDRKSVSSGT